MASKFENLLFSVDLVDKVTGKVGRIQKTLGGLADSVQSSFTQIGTGALGGAGAAYGMKELIGPALEFARASNETASLGVDDNVLGRLGVAALGTSIKYGQAASDIVRSSYDIQSSINGLVGNELTDFTMTGNILAKGVKASSGVITDYMGTMYGIFGEAADKMGRSKWIKILAGQTATAVQIFKTDGAKWSSGWTTLGADATASGIAIEEQMAVMGQLQSTMSGSEAATKYKGFLRGVGQAQDKLGLQFTDSNGNMLGMVDILEKLKGKFGDTFSVAESDALKKAFGSDEAVALIKLLMKDTTGLAANIDKIGKVKGMEKAEEMAAKMVDPMMQFEQGVNAVRIAFGSALLPVVNPVLASMAEGFGTLTKWTEMFPNLTRWVGYGAMAVLGLTAVMGSFAIIGGITQLSLIGLSGPLKLYGWLAKTAAGETALATGATWLWNKGLISAKWTMGLFSKQGIIAKGVMWLLNAAMTANPIGVMVMGFAALVASVGAVIYWWDDLKAAFLDTEWGQGTVEVLEELMGWFSTFGRAMDWLSDKLNISAWFGADEMKTGPKSSPMLDAPRAGVNTPGGLTQHITSSVSKINSNRRDVDSVNIYASQPMKPQDVQEFLLMAT